MICHTVLSRIVFVENKKYLKLLSYNCFLAVYIIIIFLPRMEVIKSSWNISKARIPLVLYHGKTNDIYIYKTI